LLSLGAAAANLRDEPEAARQYLEEAESLRSREVSVVAGDRYGTLHVAFTYPLEDIDPANSSLTWQVEVAALLFDSLTEVDETAQIIPRLAESFQLEDNARRLRIRLRDGVEFHDGRIMTAEDVCYSMKRFLRGAARLRPTGVLMLDDIIGADRFMAGETDDLEGLEIVSSHELVIHLGRSLPLFAGVLSFPALAIMPCGFEGSAMDWRKGFVGTGPFRLVRFEPRRHLELEANPRYWRAGRPQVERLVISLNIPAPQIAEGFRSGRFSLAFELAPEDHDALRRDRELGSRYVATPTLSTCFLAFNSRRGPLRSRELREEIRAAIPVASLVDRLGTLASPATGLFPPGLLGHGTSPMRDLPRSKTRMRVREPLVAGAFSVFFTSFSTFARDAVAAIEREGIPVHLELTKPMRMAGNTAYDLYFARYYCDYPASDGFGYNMLHSRNGIVGQICGSPDIDRLLELGRSEASTHVRHEIYRELELLIDEQALIVPLFHPQAFCFAGPDVEAFGVRRFFPMIPFEQVSLRRAP
jgi:ABC-type transport system substrate-binding protein